MKPLNRPMFRYGGPIKEGVMSGIREPKKNGGPMKAALVGNPVYPKTDGREHHFAMAAVPAFMGLNALRTGAMALGRRAIPKIANFFRTQTGSVGPGSVKVPKLPSGTKGRFLSKNLQTVQKSGPEMPIYSPNYLGRDPLVRTAGGLYKTVTSPTAKGIGAKAVRFATSPSSIIAGTAYYLWPDGKERTTPPPLGDSGRVGTSAAPGGGDPGMYLEPQTKKGGGVELTAEERRAKNVERYRDIMDIKGMNKDAAYNSLIAASQAINESGDFKGDIKSGKLINQIIQATSKQFDKPKATKDAIDTLILKGEIEKDIKASDPSNEIANRLREVQIKKGLRELNPSFDNLKAAFAKDNKGQSGIDLAAGAYSQNTGETFRGPLISKADFKDILSNLKKDPNTQDVDEVSIIKTWTQGQLDSSQKNIPDGNYTVGDKIVTIKDKIVVDVN